ncbi:hypothetical protein AMS68_006378 [Peltaster fructicola]|uniref:Zn(2)-C6 fungal-type domain-containing protein n=1 Tax=Peltaster fructicola TaxID=286661 RepID=A0A6H0Y1R9_9PEZI|nr:hypothetical protein AMS68_006378 [Peltaster fructicola]
MGDQAWLHQPLETTPRRTSHSSVDGTLTANLSAIRDSTSSPPESAGNAKSGVPRIRRRNRLITSCLECRRRKLKCDKTAPCANCTRFKRDCLYLAPALDAQSQQKLADIKEKMGALEKNLEREVASRTVKQHLSGASASRLQDGEGHDDDDDDDLVEDEEVLEPTPLGAIDGVYEDTGDDDLMDLGVQMGKMRISERIGGWIRPKLVEELNDTLHDLQAGKSRWSTGPQILGHGALMDYLPSRTAADQLIAQYWTAVHCMAKVIHRPSFEAQYNHFWQNIATGTEPLPSIQALMLATMFSAAVSLNDEQVAHRFRTSRSALIDTLRSGVEMALAKANFLRTTKTLVMQAFVVFLIPLVRAEISRAHSALVGTAIRLAECMGLHRDGTLYNMTPVEVHVRRMIWHQLCFLDQKTCEATGPRPQIRREDYDTRFPLNVDDADLMRPNPPTEDLNRWTEMSLMRIRAECTEMRRSNWFDMIALDKKKKSLTSVLVKIQKFRTSLESHYFPMLDDNIPFHVLSKHVIALNMNGMFIQVLHRYMFSTTTRMPDRLRQLLIECGVSQMEAAIDLESNPIVAPWAWYKGAFNQYQSALMLMVEVYAFPMRKDAGRIWKCLDYIFDIPPHLSPKQKAELVITDLRDRMEIFAQMRRVRATTQLEERVLGLSKSSLRNPEQNSPTGTHRQMSPSYSALPPSGVPMMGPNEYSSPPPPPVAESSAGGSRHGSTAAAAAGPDTPMMIDEIDWNEWDKWFSPETNNGDINIPDFDFAQFNGGYNGPPMDPMMLASGLAQAPPSMVHAPDQIPAAPGMIPNPNYIAWRHAKNQQH